MDARSTLSGKGGEAPARVPYQDTTDDETEAQFGSLARSQESPEHLEQPKDAVTHSDEDSDESTGLVSGATRDHEAEAREQHWESPKAPQTPHTPQSPEVEAHSEEGSSSAEEESEEETDA